MPVDEDPVDAAVAKASSELDEGLKTCRNVVEDYRAILSGHNDNEARAEPVATSDSAIEPVD